MAPVLAGTALEEEEEENSNPSGCVEPSLCWEPWLPLGFWWFFFFFKFTLPLKLFITLPLAGPASC